MKTRSCSTYVRYELLFVCSLLAVFFQVTYVQAAQNAVTVEIRSGEPGIVKPIGPTKQIVEMPNIQTRTVSDSDGYDTDTNAGTLNPINRMIDTINPDQTNWHLHSDQDNESLIKMIGKYIDTFYDVTPKYIFDDDDKLILTYDLKSGESPTIKVYVEALELNQRTYGENVKLTERRIKVSSYIDVSEYIKDEAVRNAILELNNAWLNKLWVPHSITLTASGNIALNSSVNIPGTDFPLPAECIRDLLSGTLTGWEEYSVELLKVTNQSKE